MTKPFKLHDFQVEARDAALTSMAIGRDELVVLPTGGGKSVVIADIIKSLKPSPTNTVLVVSHVREIIEQNHAAIARHIGSDSIGICCAALKKWEPARPIVVASVQSIHSYPFGRGFNTVLVDEAHLINPSAASMYRRLLETLRKCQPSMRMVGFSATPYRMDCGYLHEGRGSMFSRIAYEAPLSELLSRGILCPLTTRSIVDPALTDLPLRRGEFALDVLESTENISWRDGARQAVKSIAEMAADRQKLLVFCCTVNHAAVVRESLDHFGIKARVVHSKQQHKDRAAALQEFRTGAIRALVNVNVLTTGFDATDIDCVALLRPTMSTGLYVQMVGRGMRRHPKKADCLLLDFGGNVERHGPLTEIIPVTREPFGHEATQVAARKKCPSCETFLVAIARQCHSCGHLFSEVGITPFADGDPMFSNDAAMAKPLYGARGPKVGPWQFAKPKDLREAPASNYPYLSSEEVARHILTTPNYVKQMRCFGTGPTFYNSGALTAVGYRQIIYRLEDVDAWRKTLQVGGNEIPYRRRPVKPAPAEAP